METPKNIQKLGTQSSRSQNIISSVNEQVCLELNFENIMIGTSKIENTKHGNNGCLSLYDKIDGEERCLGFVLYDLRTVSNKKIVHFEGLKASVQRMGVGTKLIKALVKISKQLGAEGRLIAQASPSSCTSDNKPMTNLGFYYNLGFQATNSEKHKKIQEYINKGENIPLRLNIFTDIYLTDDGIQKLNID